uniref:Uncharacterized protein n=1 Tax=uncultured marine virus TaxID=186617 RepID=A0A0F7L8C9_9VIRU|nr:hypothetical protein [uncultured marine virus]
MTRAFTSASSASLWTFVASGVLVYGITSPANTSGEHEHGWRLCWQSRRAGRVQTPSTRRLSAQSIGGRLPHAYRILRMASFCQSAACAVR